MIKKEVLVFGLLVVLVLSFVVSAQSNSFSEIQEQKGFFSRFASFLTGLVVFPGQPGIPEVPDDDEDFDDSLEEEQISYSWQNGTWSNCNSTCMQSRIVICKKSDGSNVADSFCSGTKPLTIQSCTGGQCAPECVVGNWQDTTNYRCNSGIREIQRTRSVSPVGCDISSNWFESPCNSNQICIGQGECLTQTFYCVGPIPGNATLVAGDDLGLTQNVTRSLVSQNTSSKCEYLCNAGFNLQDNVCVKNIPLCKESHWSYDLSSCNSSGKQTKEWKKTNSLCNGGWNPSNLIEVLSCDYVPPSLEDSDGDGVPDNLDLCPNTPQGVEVNSVGCPIPKLGDLKNNSRNLSNLDLRNVSNFFVGSDRGKIIFQENVSLVRSNQEVLDLEAKIVFGNKTIFMDSLNLPELNVSAEIELYGIEYKNPKVLRDNLSCSMCEILGFSEGTLRFSVEGFSEYSVVHDDSYVESYQNLGNGGSTTSSSGEGTTTISSNGETETSSQDGSSEDPSFSEGDMTDSTASEFMGSPDYSSDSFLDSLLDFYEENKLIVLYSVGGLVLSIIILIFIILVVKSSKKKQKVDNYSQEIKSEVQEEGVVQEMEIQKNVAPINSLPPIEQVGKEIPSSENPFLDEVNGILDECENSIKNNDMNRARELYDRAKIIYEKNQISDKKTLERFILLSKRLI